jgi:phage terminase small subunit
MAELNQKQEIFCNEYLVDLNATQAAVRAGYSEKSANEQAGRLLVNASIQARISELMQERMSRLNIDQDKAVKELTKVVLAKMSDVADFDGDCLKFKSIEEIDKNEIDSSVIESIQSVDTKFGKSIKLKLHSKMAAMDILFKHLGLYKKPEEKGKRDDPAQDTAKRINKSWQEKKILKLNTG